MPSKIATAVLVLATAISFGVLFPETKDTLVIRGALKARLLYQSFFPKPHAANISEEGKALEWFLSLEPFDITKGLKALRKQADTLATVLLIKEGTQFESYSVPHKKYSADDVGAKSWASTITMQQTVNILKVIPKEVKNDRVVIYLHGGGYFSGSVSSYKGFCSEIAARFNSTVYMVDYGLCPEYTFGTQVYDVPEVYDWLQNTVKIPADKIYFGGDSAGGGLTLYTLQAIRDKKLPQPAGAFCISAWTDFSNSLPSYKTNKEKDAMIATQDPTDPHFGVPIYLFSPTTTIEDTRKHSPLYQNQEGLAPIFLQVGSYEVLLDDSVEFGKKAKAAGVDATVKVYTGMQHVFPVFYALLPEARSALDDLTNWFIKH